MTIEEMIAVLQAYKEGKQIQCCGKISNSVIWHNDSRPDWDFDTYNYRVKPEPHYRPFESAEEVMEAIKEHGGWVKFTYATEQIISVNSGRVVFGGGKNWIIGNEILTDVRFLDGTPFGKLVEE